MAEVILINPLTIINGRHAHFLRDWCGGELPTSFVYPPLDLVYVAALLRKNNINVTIIDASTLHIPHEKAIKIIKRKRPWFVGIPSAWGSFYDDLNLSKMIKQELPEVKIIISGPNVTVEPERALGSGYIDYCILGELEKPFVDIVKGKITNNVAYKSNGKIITHERVLLEDLDSLPFPARDLLPIDKYQLPFLRRNPFTTIITSRGCPYKCTFCQVNIWYLNRVRFRSVDNVLEEIDEVVNKFKIHQIIFRDPTLTFRRDRVLDLCRELIRRKYNISWRCFSCVDTVDKELLHLMKEAGCHQVSYGFESGNQEVLNLSKKGITIEQSKQAVKLTKEAGIEVSGSFMFGMYSETKRTIQETLEFALHLNCDYAQFQLATPIPSTEFYKQSNSVNKQSCFEFSRWYKWMTPSNTHLPYEFLHRKLRQAYRSFYFRFSYIYRHIFKIRSPKQFLLIIRTVFELLIHI